MRGFGRGDRDRGHRGGGRGGDRDDYGGGGRGYGSFGGGGRGGGGGGSGGFEKPVKEGQEYDITIDAVGAKGDGIGKVNNFVVFVAGAQQGERLKVRITRVFNRFAVGEKAGEAAAAQAPESEEAGEAAPSTEDGEEEAAEEESGEDEENQEAQ